MGFVRGVDGAAEGRGLADEVGAWGVERGVGDEAGEVAWEEGREGERGHWWLWRERGDGDGI